MTDQAHAPEPSEPRKRRRIEEPFYPLTWQQALQDFQDGILTPRGLIYCYFVIHLRPGAEMRVDVDELCTLLKVHESTYYRAIAALKSTGRLNVRRGRMLVGVPEIHTGQGFSQICESNSQDCENYSQDCEKNSHNCESNSQDCENYSQDCENYSQVREFRTTPNTMQDKGSRRSANVPINKETFKTNKHCLVPTTHPVVEIDREEIGTSPTQIELVPQTSMLEELSERIREVGIRPNKTIKQTLLELIDTHDPAAARQAVENALSALQEQQRQGRVRNPGGFLRAALKRGFTANRAKREARSKRHQKREPPNLVQVSAAIDQALANGDRAFALAKLQTLWAEGWQAEVQELVGFLRSDWNFQITQEGVSDEDAAVSGL